MRSKCGECCKNAKNGKLKRVRDGGVARKVV